MWVTLIVAALVAIVVLAGGGWMRRSVPVDILPTEEDKLHASRLFEVRAIPGKGKGVVALQHVPAWTLVGPYPGRVYTADEHQALKEKGLIDDEYAVEFWSGRPGERIREDRVLNPRARGAFVPRYAEAIAPFVNEPSPSTKPNLVWVWNFPKHRIEMWTRRDIRPGEELSICYGEYYERSYDTKCLEDEPSRRVIGSLAQKTPKEWYDVIVNNRVPAV